jgi:translocation and assembly module TamB
MGAPRIVADLRADRLTLNEQTLSGDGSAAIHAELEAGRIQLEGDLLGMVSLAGDGRLDAEGLDLAIRVESEALEELFELGGGRSETEFSGRFEGAVTVRSEFEDFESWSALAELAEFELSYREFGLQNLDPVVVRVTSEGVEIESFFIGDPSSDSELFVSGRIRGEETKDLDLRLQTSLDAQWLALFLPDVGLRSGTFDMLAVVRGTTEAPELNGQARVLNGRAVIQDVPFAIERVEGVLLFYPDQIVVDRIDARAAGGTLRAAGNLTLFQEAESPDYRIQIAATDLRAPFPENWLTRASGELIVSSTQGGRQIRGAIAVDQAMYLEDLTLGMTQMLSGLFSRDRLEVQSADEFAASTELNIAVTGPGALRIRNNLADLHGDLDLVVRGTLANPVLFGTVNIERGGSIEFGVNEYEIVRGVVNFANPFRIEPVIDVSARAKIRQYDVTLNLSGTLDQLNTSFTSNPPLAELEVLTLLTGGEESLTRTTGTGSGTRNEAESTSQMIAGQAASLVTQRTGRLFGLDRFQVQPLTTSSGELSQTRVTIGKQLSRDLFVTYSYDPESTAEDIYRLEWNIRHWGMTLVLTQNGDESYSADVRWEKSF